MRAVLSGDLLGLDATEIADAGAAVVCGIGVENFLIEASFGNADAIATADDGRGVENHDEKIFAIAGTADKGENAAVGVVAVNPFETRPFEVHLVERGLRSMQMI